MILQLGGAIGGARDFIGASLISATNLNYVTFQGITFEADNFYPNSVGFNNDIDGEMSLPQSIDCENCQFVTFNTVSVRHTSASGILAAATAPTPVCSGSNPPSCVVIENSTFYDIGDSGIRIGHTPSTSDTTSNVVQDIMVQNNRIQGYSRVFLDGEGIAEGSGALYYNIGNSSSSGTGNSITSNVVNNVTDSYIIDNPVTAGVSVVGSGYGGVGIYLDAQSAGSRSRTMLYITFPATRFT